MSLQGFCSAHAKTEGGKKCLLQACSQRIQEYRMICVYTLKEISVMHEGGRIPSYSSLGIPWETILASEARTPFCPQKAAHPQLANVALSTRRPQWDSRSTCLIRMQEETLLCLPLQTQSQSVLRVSACSRLAAILFSSLRFCAAPCKAFQKDTWAPMEATSFFLFLSGVALELALREVVP